MSVERRPPRSPRVREQNIYVVRRLPDLSHQRLQILHPGAVRGHGDGHRAGPLGGEGIERFARRGTCCGFAGRDVHFGAPRLEESVVNGKISFYDDFCAEGGEWGNNRPRCGVKTQAPRTTGDENDFSVEREYIVETFQVRLGFCFGSHGWWELEAVM